MQTIPKDPVMLLSYLNLKLRDEYPSLSELCASLNLSEQELRETLAAIGYQYDSKNNKFI